MSRAALVIAALGGALAACSPLVTYAPRAGECPARPSGCPFDIIADTSTRPFQIIGSIDVEAFSVRSIPKDEAAFRALVGPEVCRQGGDAVLPGVNQDGRYLFATVVRWVDVTVPPSACGTTPVDAGEVDAGEADAGTSPTASPTPQLDAGPQEIDLRTYNPSSSLETDPMSKVAHR